MQHHDHVQNHPTTAHTVEHTPVVDRVIQKVGHMFDSPHAAGSTKTTLGLDNPEHSYPKRTGGKRDPAGKHGLTKDFGAAQTGDYGGAVGNPKPEYNTMGIHAVQNALAAENGGMMGDGVGAGAGAGAGLAGAGLASGNNAAFGDHNRVEDDNRSSLDSNASSTMGREMGSNLPGGLTNARIIKTETSKTDPALIAEFDHNHSGRGTGLFNSHAGEPGGIQGDHDL